MNDAPGRPGPAIRFDGVTKRYGPVLALDRVSFTIAPGEMVALAHQSRLGRDECAEGSATGAAAATGGRGR